MNGKKMDFLSNKLNKYSIRKFTVGTASILVGATLLFGLSNETEAQEKSTNSTDIEAVHNDNQVSKEEAPEEATAEEKASGSEVASKEEAPEEATAEEKASGSEVASKEEAPEEATAEDKKTKTEDIQNSDEITDNRKLISSELSNLVKNELKDTEKEEIINKLEKTTPSLSEEEVKKVVLAEILKDYSDKQNSQPKATFRSAARTTSSGSENKLLKESENVTRAANDNMVTVKGTNNFKDYGDVTHRVYPEEFPEDGVLTAINPVNKPNTGTSGVLEYNNKIDFNKDFPINGPVADIIQGNTTGSDGWGFIFTKGTGLDDLDKGDILRDKGLTNAAGFKIDTSYSNVGVTADAMDADKKNYLSQIGGAAKIGYGTFVTNGADGVSKQVGSNALGSKDKPINKIQYADNTTNHNDGKFHGQRLNNVTLSYNASTGIITAS